MVGVGGGGWWGEVYLHTFKRQLSLTNAPILTAANVPTVEERSSSILFLEPILCTAHTLRPTVSSPEVQTMALS